MKNKYKVVALVPLEFSAQVNTIFDYISKFNRYDMNVSKVMAD